MRFHCTFHSNIHNIVFIFDHFITENGLFQFTATKSKTIYINFSFLRYNRAFYARISKKKAEWYDESPLRGMLIHRKEVHSAGLEDSDHLSMLNANKHKAFWQLPVQFFWCKRLHVNCFYCLFWFHRPMFVRIHLAPSFPAFSDRIFTIEKEIQSAVHK